MKPLRFDLSAAISVRAGGSRPPRYRLGIVRTPSAPRTTASGQWAPYSPDQMPTRHSVLHGLARTAARQTTARGRYA